MSNKRYFWLKLKEDFFQDDAIEWLEEQKNGKEYALFYLKLCLKSLKTDGLLMRQVGNILVPYDANKLAEITRTSPDTVMVAMELLKQIGLVEIMDGGAIYMVQLQEMVGSETTDAARMRRRRAQKALEAAQNNAGVTISEHCSHNVSTNVTAEIEKELEKDIEIEKENGAADAPPATAPVKDKKPVKHKYGEYKNVLLTDEEMEKLRELFPDDLQVRIERLSEYIASTGKSYKSHYATIRSWANRDGKQHRSPARRGQAAGPVGPNGIVLDPTKTDLDGHF